MWSEIIKWIEWFGTILLYSLIVFGALLLFAAIPAGVYGDIRDYKVRDLQQSATIILSNPSEYIVEGPIVKNKKYKQTPVKIDNYTGVYIQYLDRTEVVLNAQVWGKQITISETLNDDGYILGKKIRRNLSSFIQGFMAKP